MPMTPWSPFNACARYIKFYRTDNNDDVKTQWLRRLSQRGRFYILGWWVECDGYRAYVYTANV